jgi:hypothetical protein
MTESKPSKKAIVTDEHKAEARKLKSIWDRVGPSSQGEFGKEHGVGGQSAVANFLTGQSALSLKAAVGFANGLGCKIRDFSQRLADEARGAAEAAGLMGGDDDYVPIARLNVEAGAGAGRVAQVVEVEGSLQFRHDFLRGVSLSPQNAAIINVRGSSMEPTIKDGSVILINRADKEPRDGYIYAFAWDDELLVKRFRSRDGTWWATSDNGDKDANPDIELDGLTRVVVQGRAIWMGAKL